MKFQFTLREWFVVVAIIGVLFLLLFDKQQLGGHGYPPLRLDFAAVDDASNRPIPHASIEILIPENEWMQHVPSGNAIHTPEGLKYTFATSDEGTASEQLTDVFFDFNESYRGPLLVKRSHYYQLPRWKFRVTAEGYAPSQWEMLGANKRGFKSVHVPHGKSYLPITIRLKATNSPATATSE